MIKQIAKQLLSKQKKIIKKLSKNIYIPKKNNQKIIEHMEIDFILSRYFYKKNFKILEIGSHQGEIFNILLTNNFKQKFDLTCIEPNPDSFRTLQSKYSKKIKSFIDAKFYNFGVSLNGGILTFYSPSESTTLFTLLEDNLEKFDLKNESIKKIKIQTYSISQLLHDKKYLDRDYDLIKIDTEGYDYIISLEILKEKISFQNLMIELDTDNFQKLKEIFEKLKHFYVYLFLREGINTLTIEKINTFEQIFELSEYFQNKIKSPIAGNILFLK
ncbi:FkbM family methyltransferase [Acidimicrobiaceae bacterium]|nr:FkbM family methyltransferase [Acidimicrobiaceae bacterium]